MHYLLLIMFVLYIACSGACGDDVRLISVDVQPNKVNPNLLGNGSFELLDSSGFPSEWKWDRRNTDSSCELDTSTAVGGQRSLKITNRTPLESPYTGQLHLTKTVRVESGKPYTISAWTKSDDPGLASICAGHGWPYRIMLPPTGGEWKPVSVTFVPNEQSLNLNVDVQSESPTRGFWLDNLKVEAGEHATYDEVAGGAMGAFALWPMGYNVELLTEGDFTVPFLLCVPKAVSGTIEATLSTSRGRITQRVELKPGMVQVAVSGRSAGAGYQPRTVTLRLLSGGRELAAARTDVSFYSQPFALARLQALDQALPGLKKQIETLKSRGQDVSYPLVSYTVLENFAGYTREDAEKNEVKRAVMAVADMEAMKRQLDRELSEALRGRRTFPAVPRWTGDARPVVERSSFIAPTVTPGKAGREMRPVFFNGYGHFSQVRADVEKFPSYGINMIQVEVGPSSTLPAEGVVNEAPVQQMLNLLDRAQKSGVTVNLLISPHYVPAWVNEKIRQESGSSTAQSYHLRRHPVSREMLKRHIEVLIPPLKDHPALHSICLANEPTYYGDASEHAVRDWHAWLKDRHGDIATLNARWGTRHAGFEEIRLPYAQGENARQPIGRWMDFVRWNQEFLASWYEMLGELVKDVAPGMPVHMKVQTPTLLNYAEVHLGNDPYLVACANDINGNDNINWPSFGHGEFAQSWMSNARGYDLQRSMKDAPVFNSENHIIGDRDTRYVPSEIVRAALWQQAIHGQSANVIWVWERVFDPKHDFAGSIMHRPACAEAVGIVNHDLNRAAPEVTALQQAPAQVLILHSTSAMVHDGELYDTCAKRLYMALSFRGVKIGFVSERQLEAGLVPEAPVVLIPYAKHLSDTAFATLQRYGGRVVMAGSGLLSANEYGQPRSSRLNSKTIPYARARTSERDLWEALPSRLAAWGVRPRVELLDGEGRPVWGVEWQVVETAGGTLVNLCNYLTRPVSLRLSVDGGDVGAVDVLTGSRVAGPMELQSLEFRLLRVK